MPTDILYVHPGNQRRIYQELSKEFTAIAPPVWTSLLAQYSRNHGHSTAIYDANLEGWDEGVARELMREHQPRLIVMMVYGHNPSASTQTMPAAGAIARDIKALTPGTPIAMGGIHPSALPEKTLLEEAVDFVIQGEGIHTIEGLVQHLKGKTGLQDIGGLWYRDSAGTRFSSPAPLVEDLDDDLDAYAWDLLPHLSRYRAHNMHCFHRFEQAKREDFSDVRSPYATMYTSLGCPYSCHYCCINAVFGKSRIRYWSLERVLFWLDTLVSRHGVTNIRLDDELFILSPKRVERFCDMVIERNYDLNFWVYGRVDTVRSSLLEKLAKAGVRWICLGIESGNARVREHVNKTIKTDIRNIVGEIQRHGIYVLGNFMFGLPEDNMVTMQETLDLAMELKCEFVNFYAVMAYPGSALYDWASKQGGYLPSGWAAYSQHSCETQPLPTNHVSAKEVLRFRDAAFRRYYDNPSYLTMMEHKFGNRVREHLERMLEIKLERKLV